MEDRDKTPDQLLEELSILRQDVDRLKIQELAHEAQNELLRTLVSMGENPSFSLMLRSLSQQTLKICNRLTEAEESSLFLLDESGKVIESVLARGATIKEQKDSLIGRVLDKGLAGWVNRKHQVGLVTDTVRDERWLPLPGETYTVRSALCVPILRSKRLLGLVTLMHPQPGHFRYEAAHLMQLTMTKISLVFETIRILTSHPEEALPAARLSTVMPNQAEISANHLQDLPTLTDSLPLFETNNAPPTLLDPPLPTTQNGHYLNTPEIDTLRPRYLSTDATDSTEGLSDSLTDSTTLSQLRPVYHPTDAPTHPLVDQPTGQPFDDLDLTETPQPLGGAGLHSAPPTTNPVLAGIPTSSLPGQAKVAPIASRLRANAAQGIPTSLKVPPPPPALRQHQQQAQQQAQILSSPSLQDNALSELGLYIVVWDGKFLYANSRLAKIFGYRFNELATLGSIFQLVSDSHFEFVSEKIYQCVRGQIKHLCCRFQGKRKDGELLDVEIYGVRTQFYGKSVMLGALRSLTPMPKKLAAPPQDQGN